MNFWVSFLTHFELSQSNIERESSDKNTDDCSKAKRVRAPILQSNSEPGSMKAPTPRTTALAPGLLRGPVVQISWFAWNSYLFEILTWFWHYFGLLKTPNLGETLKAHSYLIVHNNIIKLIKNKMPIYYFWPKRSNSSKNWRSTASKIWRIQPWT